ncbi:hypothetical protein CGMCC3_g15807 [Colletotrichum fructicola]|nr:uncharacterized protein CGMCC3_g15807 [Colletotrichum fructicola]KAE9568030.1 hypothetical protein CGMCC3_g15807 [Colletotrichum fructicola]
MDVGIADTNAVVDLAWRGIHASAGHSRRDRPEREPVLACTLGATRRGLPQSSKCTVPNGGRQLRTGTRHTRTHTNLSQTDDGSSFCHSSESAFD